MSPIPIAGRRPLPPVADIASPAAPRGGRGDAVQEHPAGGARPGELDAAARPTQAVEQLVTGGDVNPAEVLTTLQKADMSFQLMLQIRNKLVQAYQEVNNIRI